MRKTCFLGLKKPLSNQHCNTFLGDAANGASPSKVLQCWLRGPRIKQIGQELTELWSKQNHYSTSSSFYTFSLTKYMFCSVPKTLKMLLSVQVACGNVQDDFGRALQLPFGGWWLKNGFLSLKTVFFAYLPHQLGVLRVFEVSGSLDTVHQTSQYFILYC